MLFRQTEMFLSAEIVRFDFKETWELQLYVIKALFEQFFGQ